MANKTITTTNTTEKKRNNTRAKVATAAAVELPLTAETPEKIEATEACTDVVLHADNSPVTTNIAAEIKADFELQRESYRNTMQAAALEKIAAALKNVKAEMLSVRAVVRAICQLASEPAVKPLAEYLKLTEGSNKTARENAVDYINKTAPYVIETTIDNITSKTPAVLTEVAPNVYKAAPIKGALKVVEAAVNNTSRAQKVVKNGVYYNADAAELESQDTAKNAAKEATAAAKTERKNKQIEAAKKTVAEACGVNVDNMHIIGNAVDALNAALTYAAGNAALQQAIIAALNIATAK